MIGKQLTQAEANLLQVLHHILSDILMYQLFSYLFDLLQSRLIG